MLKNEYLKQWTNIVSQKMAHLTLPQVLRLATWSFGMVMTKSSSLSKLKILKAKSPKPLKMLTVSWAVEVVAPEKWLFRTST
ncbi:hypothetical protein I8751_21345 [Nostocaceae cyanobacterium CENA357]|uniref:Uncharacterized protein n=1 Tax=Atlanticothrix silvestris CENA357 TaxID=1725252 RepID=A0A8J7HGZ6_9CYAN|nr:hypothetical protein [Atlanticothrix silvestris CENA357]